MLRSLVGSEMCIRDRLAMETSRFNCHRKMFEVFFSDFVGDAIQGETKIPHSGSSSHLRVGHLSHYYRLAQQYNTRTRTNSKASLTTQGVSYARRLLRQENSVSYVDPDILRTGKARNFFMKPQHPGRLSEIPSDIDRQNQWLRHQL